MSTLDERRARLRAATTAPHQEVLGLLHEAFDGASEADRKALARTLPPGRWAGQEGPTPRAVLVFAALGGPTKLAETLLPVSGRGRRGLDGAAAQAVRGIVRQAVAGRDDAWREAWVDAVAEHAVWNPWLAHGMLDDVVGDHDLHPTSLVYLRRCLVRVSPQEGSFSDRFLAHDLWQLFRVEGMGSDYYLVDGRRPEWDRAFLHLCATRPGFRDRLLTESLDALLRDFPATQITWYHRVHRLVEPTPDEIRAREARYLAVLRTRPSVAVGLAQDMLRRAAPTGLTDVPGLLDASRAVLGRTEKKVLDAQVRLLGDLVRVDPGHAAAVGEVLDEARGTLPPTVAERARRLVPDRGRPEHGDEPDAATVAVPGPRVADLPRTPDVRAPVRSTQEAFDLVSEHLEGVGDGVDLSRLVRWLRGTAVQTAPAWPADAPSVLLDRAQAVLDEVWDHGDMSPRRCLAALVLARAGREVRQQPEFRGFLTLLPRAPGQIGAAWGRVATHAPSVLLAQTVQRHTQAVQRRETGPDGAGTGDQADRPAPRVSGAWTRAVVPPGRGRWGNADGGPGWPAQEPGWPFWRRAGGPADGLHDRALDVTDVPTEAWFRVTSARDQDGFDQIVQWTAWLLQENPDVLAAHAHPMLLAATVVQGVRGTAPLLSALGGTHRLPGAPTCSALALGLSARTAEHRAQAAEAVAALAGSGLLHPDALAEQIALHLADGFVMTGRVAGALGDAASISAVAGYRVLQVAAALLPHLDGVTGAVRVVELAARLAGEYGTPVVVPEALARRAKGASAMALAVRGLLAVRPRRTDLVEQAAVQAEASLVRPA